MDTTMLAVFGTGLATIGTAVTLFAALWRVQGNRFDMLERHIDKQFEAVDKQFEAADKRWTDRFEMAERASRERFERATLEAWTASRPGSRRPRPPRPRRRLSDCSFRLRLAGRGEKIHENVCRYRGLVPIREVWRARRATAAIRRVLDLGGTRGTCGASNAWSETRRS
jgi:hypothetical protein